MQDILNADSLVLLFLAPMEYIVGIFYNCDAVNLNGFPFKESKSTIFVLAGTKANNRHHFGALLTSFTHENCFEHIFSDTHMFIIQARSFFCF